MLKAAGEAKAADRTRVVEQATATDVPREPLARRSGTEAEGAWVLWRALNCRVAGGRMLAVEAT